MEARDGVLARYRPLFTADGIRGLSAAGFRDFLMFRNNRHWWGLQRLGPRVTEDMAALRQALLRLVDESVPVRQRADPGAVRLTNSVSEHGQH